MSASRPWSASRLGLAPAATSSSRARAASALAPQSVREVQAFAQRLGAVGPAACSPKGGAEIDQRPGVLQCCSGAGEHLDRLTKQVHVGASRLDERPHAQRRSESTGSSERARQPEFLVREPARLLALAGGRQRERVGRSPRPQLRRERSGLELGRGGPHFGESRLGVSECEAKPAVAVTNEQQRQELHRRWRRARFPPRPGRPPRAGRGRAGSRSRTPARRRSPPSAGSGRCRSRGVRRPRLRRADRSGRRATPGSRTPAPSPRSSPESGHRRAPTRARGRRARTHPRG